MPNVLITGGARRLGKAMALRFAKAGWNVGILYHSSVEKAEETSEILRSFGVKCAIAQADVRLSAEIGKAFDCLSKSLGMPDVLLNNAGTFPPPLPLKNIDDSIWDDTINTNLRAYFYSARKYSEMASSGRIINIASLGAFEVWKNRIPYNVSKAGVIQLTKALARELAPNFSVNSISPGTIEIPEEPAVEESTVSPAKIPMQRLGNADDLYDSAYFFSTCSKYITGQNLNVDGGFHLVK